MQVLGYILGAIFIACLVGVTAWNIYKLVKAVKERQKMKKETDVHDVQKGE